MTLSAVSMQMKSLEGDLGVTLFDRAHRPPKLTPDGRRICDHAEAVLKAESALLATSQSRTGLSGIYRMGFVPTASVRLLPDFLMAAERDAPQASFEIATDLSDALEDRVLSGDLDAAVITASSDQRGLQMDVLRHEALSYASCHPGNLEVLFATLPFLHFLPKSGIGKLIANHVGGRASRTITLDSVEAIMECVNRGIGFTLLPAPDIERFAVPDVIKTAEPGGLSRDLVLITRTTSQTSDLRTGIYTLFQKEV